MSSSAFSKNTGPRGEAGNTDRWSDSGELGKVRHSLEAARRRAIAKGKSTLRGILQLADKHRIDEALSKVLVLCSLYQEMLFDRAHSARVRHMLDDIEGLQDLLIDLGGGTLSPATEGRIRARIKSFHHETRVWMAMLPLQEGAKWLPAKEDMSQEERINRMKELWRVAEGAKFAPPPREARRLEGTAPWLQIEPIRLPDGKSKATDPIDVVGDRRWTCRPREMVELLGFAHEALMIEVEGPDRGGQTTFAQRRLGTHPKDSFAISCLLIYESVVGPNSAKQSNAEKRGKGLETDFERFCGQVSSLTLGVGVAQDWAIGLDPFRRAIATSRAWLALYQAAGCEDAESFEALPLVEQEGARKSLPEQVRRRLSPDAPPWV